MDKIDSYENFVRKLKSYSLERIFWFGTRASDVSGLTDLLGIKGIISCYGGNEFENKIPVLSDDTNGTRKKTSGDELSKELLTDNKYIKFIKKCRFSAVFPYDAPLELEIFCTKNDIKCFSTSSLIKDQLRNKTKVEDVSKSINLPIIPGVSGLIEEFDYNNLVRKLGSPLFLQFEGSAGSGNFIVNTLEEFEHVKKLKRKNKLNIKKYFDGRACSIDICVTPRPILCGTLEEMLIGAEPLNSNPTEYVGGSWFENGFSYKLRKKICQIGIALGEYMRNRGFMGYFHPDFLIEDDNVYLTEVNMRFGGSCGIYAKAELASKRVPLMGIHLLTYCEPKLQYLDKKINNKNLEPLNFAFMVIKNNYGKTITITNKLKSGLYRISSSNFELIDPNATFHDFKKDDQIFVIGLPSSRHDVIVKQGAFICQLVTRFPIVDKQNKLNFHGKKLADRFVRFLVS